MGRTRQPFERPEGKLSSRLIVIASEGQKDRSENIYFKALKTHKSAKNVHIELLERDDSKSSPMNVKAQLDKFVDQYEIADDDELWAVVDRDRWNLEEVSEACKSDNINLCVSNPCFEIWLMLHLWTKKQFYELSDETKAEIFANKNDFVKKLVKTKMPEGYSERKYNATSLLPKTNHAIELAKELDINPNDEWPKYIGTRMYKLLESVMRK